MPATEFLGTTAVPTSAVAVVTVPAPPSTALATTTTVTTTTIAPYELSAPTGCEIGDTLSVGFSGEPVRCLQRRLDDITPVDQVVADGQFGPATEQAVRQFQMAQGLVVDGIVGKQTAEALGIWNPAAATAVARPQQAVAVASGGDCNPNYSGCVPNDSDVDCAGGSGNGPSYTGRVRVIGVDVYDLDDNRDGIACDGS